jgi:hypothetical protein
MEIILNFTTQDFFVVTLEGEARPWESLQYRSGASEESDLPSSNPPPPSPTIHVL